jgi:RNA polymerase sigma-70 factor (ECF subfamily)
VTALRLATAPPPEEADDVVAAQKGDRAAQRELFDRHRRAVFGYCLVAASRDRDLALDLLQETFARAFRALPRLTEPEKFRGWLFTIAANVCRSRGAQETRRRDALESLTLEQDLDAGASDDPEQREQRIEAVRKVLAHIEEPQLRQIVQFKYGDPEHTTREIAERLSMPHGTVTVKLMRFRAAIRRQLLHALVSEGVEP